MEQSEYVQSDLRFLIPLHEGDQAIIFGGPMVLGDAIRSEKVNLFAAEDPDAIASESADHIFIPELTKDLVRGFPNEYLRILKPSGWIFVGIHNAQSFERLQFWKHIGTRPLRLSAKRCKRLFEQTGVEVIDFYGVSKNLNHPQFLISLIHKQQAAFFFDHMYYPYSRIAAAMQVIARWMVALGLQRFLFNDIVVVARRANSLNHDLQPVGKSDRHLV
jgi:hypothetical protein